MNPMSEEILPALNAHPIALAAVLVVVAIFALRTTYWKFSLPSRLCDTCGRTGEAKRVVRGSYWFEIPVLVLGLSVGLVVHLILFFAILILMWRTLGSYLVCPACGSERLEKN